MKITEIILKVTSVCNLNCSYCYVFNKGEKSYLTEPKIISQEVCHFFLERVEEYCKNESLKSILIIFHGGEPLLIGKDFYRQFVREAKEIVKSADLRFSLQTNGTLINEEWCNLFRELNIQVGVSVDGTEKSTVYRIYRKDGSSAYKEIIKGIECLQTNIGDVSALMVVNVKEPPSEIYNFFKNKGITMFNVLFPDCNYDDKDVAVGKIGDWLIELFDCWFWDKAEKKPDIRSFRTIMNILLGNDNAGDEMFGNKYNGVVSVKTNGNIEPTDSLKICGEKRCYGINVRKNSLCDVSKISIFEKYYSAHQNSVLNEECQKCIIKDICGGGQLAHRYSKNNGFDNPSVYCMDIRKLVMHIQNTIFDIADLGEFGCEKLTINDFV